MHEAGGIGRGGMYRYYWGQHGKALGISGVIWVVDLMGTYDFVLHLCVEGTYRPALRKHKVLMQYI